MNNKLISVVIPVYNVEKYLDRCLESVVNQTYRNLEIILVDDGSPDRCPQICDEWASKDERIRVIHKENQGLGMARNSGIEYATGDYICFFDSDDYVELDLIELAVNAAKESNADLVLYGMGAADNTGKVIARALPRTPKDFYKGAEICNDLLPELLGPNPQTGRSIGLSLSAWRVLISMDPIRHSGWRFVSEREIISEDFYSMLKFYRHVDSVAVLKKSLYYYCYNGASLSHSYKPDRFEKVKHFYEKCLELCDSCDYSENVKYRCAYPFLGGVFSSLKGEVVHNKISKALASVRRIINDETLQMVLCEHKDDCFNRKKKIFFWCARNKLVLACYVLLRAKIKAAN